MENTEAKIYSEVDALLNLMGNYYINMLPKHVINSINEKKDKNYKPVYSMNIPLEKQNIQKDSLAIMANIQYNYFCVNEKEKQEFLKELQLIDKKYEQEIREKYNPDNIFKNRGNNDVQKEEQSLVVVEDESFIEKIFNFFNNLLKRLKLR